MVRIATVGTSTITGQFIASCRKTGRYRFITAYSRDPARAALFASQQGFQKSCCSLKELARDEQVDAVYIASPNALHYVQSRLFLENGKHVLCEKPAVTESRQYRGLAALAEKKGLIYMEAIMSRHSAGRTPLLEALSRIGRISQARIDYSQLSSRYEKLLAGEQVNIFDMSLGAGSLMDLGIYCVYAAVDLFGMPDSILSRASFLENGADSAGTAIFGYPDFSAVLTYGKIGQSALGTEIIGDKGTVKIGAISQYTGICLVQNGTQTALFGTPDRLEIMSGEAEQFADYIESPASSGEAYREAAALACRVHQCMDQIKQYAKIKYPIKETVL